MKVFISWSGETSKHVATALYDWLPTIIQSADPWMSAAAINAGDRWSSTLEDVLNNASFGIVCVTPENQTEPWINFETGALAKTIKEKAFVCPFLIKMRISELSCKPLTQFQAKQADREGTYDLVCSINKANKTNPLQEDILKKAFDRGWGEFEQKLSDLPVSDSCPTRRNSDDLVEEAVINTRDIKRMLGDIVGTIPATSASDFFSRHICETHNKPQNPIWGFLRRLNDDELKQLMIVLTARFAEDVRSPAPIKDGAKELPSA